MTEKKFPFDGTDGQSVTASVTGATQQANGTWTYSAGAALEGPTGLRAVVGTATTTISRFAPTATNVLMSVGMSVRIDQVPTKTFHVFASMRNSGGPAFRIIFGADGRLGMRGSGTTATEVTSSQTLTVGKMYWMSLLANATAQTATAKFYDTSTRALTATIDVPAGALSFNGTGVFSAYDIGWVNSDPVSGQSVAFDSLVIDDGSTTEKMPASWATPTGLKGTIFLSTGLVNGVYRVWEGSSQTELQSLTLTGTVAGFGTTNFGSTSFGN